MRFYENKNLNTLVWDRISYNANREELFLSKDLWGMFGLSRATGFTGGAPSQATYIVTALPLLIILALYKNNLIYYIATSIAVIGLALTMSRTGILAIIVAFLVLIVIERSRLFKKTPFMILLFLPTIILFVVYWGYIKEIFMFRFVVDQTRLDMYKSSITLFEQYPILGVGYNNYSIARFALKAHDANVHNNWLTILLELGIVGLTYILLFFGYVFKIVYKKKNIISLAFISAFSGLLIAGFFNQIFDLFYFNFWIVLMFTTSTLDNPQSHHEYSI